MQKMLTSKQLAELLGTTSHHVKVMRLRGTGPRFYRLGSRSVRYRENDVEAWIKTREAGMSADLPRGEK